MGQGSQDSDGCDELVNLDWMENGGLGLLRRRVVPPTGFGAQMQQFSFPGAEQFDSEEDFSGEALFILFGFSVCSKQCVPLSKIDLVDKKKI